MTELTRRPAKGPDRGWVVYFRRRQHRPHRLAYRRPGFGAAMGLDLRFLSWLDPGQQIHGTGETFEEARAGFEEAWNRLRATRTEAHFELWRHNRDWNAWKYRMHEKGLKLPTETKNDLARCFCGLEITNRSIDAHIRAFHRGMGA